MEFRILGPLEVRGEGGQRLPLPSGRHRALLALLLLHANEVVATERLIEELWEGEPTENAATALYGYISQLRKALGDGGRQLLHTRAPGYLIELEPDQLDATHAEQLVAAGRAALREGEPGQAAATLREALSLWRGAPLAELAYESFAQAEIRRLEELRLAALEERIEADLALGRHGDVIGELGALVADHPLRERLRGQLMLALYRGGRQAEALAVYQDGRRALVEELGIEPSRPLQELEQKILRQDPDLDLIEQRRPAPAPQKPAPLQAAPRSAPAEERKVVSVLFVDLVGFTARSDLADPEDVRAALRPFHVAAKRQIERFGGTVEKFIGDAVMAVFGAPVAHEDDPERAVRAALAIRDWIGDDGAELQVRMAVNTGVALVSLHSRPQQGEPIATGDVVNTAQRLEAAAPVNGILVGEQTYRATRGAIDYRQAPAIEAKGKSRPIPVWEVFGARSRLGIDLVREPETPLVGRRRELDLLLSTLERVREERSPQLVTLVGVPGIGKSRLVFELFNAVEQDRALITWRQGRCLPYGDGVSFWALGEIVKAQAGILESDDPEQAEQKLRKAVAEVVADAHEAPWVEQQLQPLVGAVGDLGLGEPSGEAFAGWRHFFEGLAEKRPLVLLLEDLHWADEGLLEFVDELADRVRYAPLLVLCTARPELLERRPGWGGGKANALTISLPPLSDDETGEIIAALLEQPPPLVDVQNALLARAAGNPLYAEQFARVVAEIGRLDQLPETVHGIIAARLDGLLPQEKALLQDAAVVGKVFWLGALEAVGGVPRRQAEEVLVGLERKEFVQRALRPSVAGEAEYAFRHVLLRDVAYEQIPRANRAEKHRRGAAWIESLGREEDHAEMLAHHYSSALEYAEVAGSPDPDLAQHARLALRAAGDRALVLASYAAAARFYSAALELWPAEDPDRVWLLVHTGRARNAADGTGTDLLERGLEELRSRGDADGAAAVAVDLARCSWSGGDRDAAYSYVDEALQLARRRGASSARAYALVARAGYHMVASEYDEAIVVAREALPLTENLRLDALRARIFDVLGIARALSGDIGGIDDSKRAIALARDANAFMELVVAEDNLHAAQFFLGQLDGAWETLAQHSRDAERYGPASDRAWARGSGAYMAVVQGRWDEAIPTLDELIAAAEDGAAHYMEPAWYALRASLELARADVVGASRDSERALDRARTAKDPQSLAPALTVRAMVLVEQGFHADASLLTSEVLALRVPLVSALLQENPAATLIEFAWLVRTLGRAEELLPVIASAPSTPWVDASGAIVQGDFVHASQLIAKIGAPSVEAYTRLRTAEELAQAGAHEQACEHLVQALAFFRQVGATRYLAQAEQVLASA
jgi:DNA-binding SARP family transcriptional activator